MLKSLLSIVLLSVTMTAVAQKIEFKADINEMSPMSYPSRMGLTGFTFEMRNDSASVHLPYMGEVYTPTYSSDGLNFDEPCDKLEIKPNKKKDGYSISFSLRHDTVLYKFSITLWDNNTMEIFMLPSNAQGCRYSGDWEGTCTFQ